MNIRYITEEQLEKLLTGETVQVTRNGVTREIRYDDDDVYVVQSDYATIAELNAMFLKVMTTEVMNTSTLPSIQVPKLTADQIGMIQTAISQGKEVTVDASYGGITNQFKVLESDHDGDMGGIRLTYYNNYLDYIVDGEQVTVSHVALGGGGGVTVDLLWENANLASEFAEQDIEIDMTGYDYLLLTSAYHYSVSYNRYNATATVDLSAITEGKGHPSYTSTICHGDSAGQMTTTSRLFSINATKTSIHFYKACALSRLSDGSFSYRYSENYSVPVMIKGVKL